MLLALTACNKTKPMTEAEQKAAFWKTNTVYLYNEQNPSMRMKLTIPKGIYEPYYLSKKNSDSSYDEKIVSFSFEPDELDAFVNQDVVSVLKTKEVKRNAGGDHKKYDFVARNFEIQLRMSPTLVDSAYFERLLKANTLNSDGDFTYLFNKNWLILISSMKIFDSPNKLSASIELFHKNGLHIHLIGSRQLDGEKVSPKRDQIIKNVIAMVDSFNPELSQ